VGAGAEGEEEAGGAGLRGWLETGAIYARFPGGIIQETEGEGDGPGRILGENFALGGPVVDVEAHIGRGNDFSGLRIELSDRRCWRRGDVA